MIIAFFASNMPPQRVRPNLAQWLVYNSAARQAIGSSVDQARANRPPNRQDYVHALQLERVP